MNLKVDDLLVIKKNYFMSDGYELMKQPTQRELDVEQLLKDTNHLVKVIGFPTSSRTSAICRQVIGMEYVNISSDQVQQVIPLVTTKPTRKIIQLDQSRALCDDGTIWNWVHDKWEQGSLNGLQD